MGYHRNLSINVSKITSAHFSSSNGKNALQAELQNSFLSYQSPTASSEKKRTCQLQSESPNSVVKSAGDFCSNPKDSETSPKSDRTSHKHLQHHTHHAHHANHHGRHGDSLHGLDAGQHNKMTHRSFLQPCAVILKAHVDDRQGMKVMCSMKSMSDLLLESEDLSRQVALLHLPETSVFVQKENEKCLVLSSKETNDNICIEFAHRSQSREYFRVMSIASQLPS
eukprot:755719-Hanusia_phi.AAC.2